MLQPALLNDDAISIKQAFNLKLDVHIIKTSIDLKIKDCTDLISKLKNN